MVIVQYPTDSELSILSVLWARRRATVREVHDALGRETGYTTVLKMMQIMTEKGLLLRDDTDRSHVYRPAIAQKKTQRHLAADLLRRAFGGSLRKLMVAALSAEHASADELAEIRKLIDEAGAASAASLTSKGRGTRAKKDAKKGGPR